MECFMNKLFNFLPKEIIAGITDHADSKTKRALSMLDHRINAVVLDTVRSIRVFPRSCSSLDNHPSDIPQVILVKVISRNPKLEEIIFAPEFGAKEVPYLRSLISYLESNQDEHPLNSVKKIRFKEVQNS